MGLGKDLPLWLQLFLQFINFAILVAALVYFLRKPLKEYLLKRHDTVKEKIEEADRLLREAEEAKKKYEERLMRLEGEIEAFRASALVEMEREKKKILDDARGLASRISEQARLAYEQEMKEALAKVRAEIAQRTITAAERKVREMFRKEDHDRMVEEFIQKVRSIN
jgi:F-type H+-transporting ATPase subunit b